MNGLLEFIHSWIVHGSASAARSKQSVSAGSGSSGEDIPWGNSKIVLSFCCWFHLSWVWWLHVVESCQILPGSLCCVLEDTVLEMSVIYEPTAIVTTCWSKHIALHDITAISVRKVLDICEVAQQIIPFTSVKLYYKHWQLLFKSDFPNVYVHSECLSRDTLGYAACFTMSHEIVWHNFI